MSDENAIPGGQIWPHSPANEEAFIGSALIDPEALREISLDPEDFYIRRNQWIYEAITELMRTGQGVDYITVCTALDRSGHLAEIGGYARVMQLINTQASSLHIESYAEVIREKARRRRVLRISQALTSAAFAEDTNLASAISEALEGLSRSVVKDRGARHISQYVSSVFDQVQKAIANPKDIYGIPTGFLDWDKITSGLQPGEVVKLSGEPGLGKSLLAMQVLSNAAKAGHPGALYELEMSGDQVVRRRVSSESEITTAALRSGRIDDPDYPMFVNAIQSMSNLPVYISDCSEMTTMDIRADLQRLKDKHGVELAVIDYEGLLDDDNDKDANTRSTLISKRVHAIFKDLNIAGISIAGMNKDGIRGTAKGQGAVAGTSNSLHDADQIIVMRKNGDDGNLIRCTWEKMREGEADRFFDLVKLEQFPTFKDAMPQNNGRYQ